MNHRFEVGKCDGHQIVLKLCCLCGVRHLCSVILGLILFLTYVPNGLYLNLSRDLYFGLFLLVILRMLLAGEEGLFRMCWSRCKMM
jgi:hypothetical protein